MKRRRILLALALPLGLLVLLAGFLVFTLTTQPGLRMLLALARSVSDGQVTVQTASGRLGSACTLEGLHLNLSGTTISIDKLELTWHPGALFHKELHIENIFFGGVHVQLPAEETSQPAEERQSRLPALSWPLALRLDHLVLDDVHLSSGEKEVLQLRQARAEAVQARGQELRFAAVAAKNSWMDLRARGQIRSEAAYPLRVELDYAFDCTGYRPLRGQGLVAGELAGSMAVETTLSAPQQVRLRGELRDVLSGLQWQAQVHSPHLALERFNGSWPVLALHQVQIQGSGDVRSYALELNGQARLPQLRRPLAVQGRLQVGLSGLLVQELHLSDTAGQVDLSGSLDWSPFLQWQAKASAKEFNPDLVAAELSGALSGAIVSRGSMQGERHEVELQLDGLSGQLRGYPLTAAGSLAYRDDTLSLNQIHAAVGRSTLELQGTVQERLALEFALQAPDLQELLPHLAGHLQARARVEGSREEPVLNATLAGSGLSYAGTHIETLSGRVQGVLSESRELAAELQAHKLLLGGTLVEEAQARLQGSLARQILQLEARTKKEALALELAGQRQDAGWTGEVRQLRFDVPAFGRWRQQQPARLELSAAQAQLAPLCVAMEDSTLCVHGQWQREKDHWQGTARLAGLPLERLQRWLPQAMHIGGTLDVEAEATGVGGKLQQGRVLGLSPGLRLDFFADGAAVQHLVWKTHRLEATYNNERLQASWNSAFEDGGSLTLQLASGHLVLPGSDLRQVPLEGRADVDLRGLAFLDALSKQQSRWSGALRGNMELRGSLARPLLSGTVNLEDGEVLVPELSLQLAPLQLELSGSEGRLAALLQARSQQGQLQVQAGVTYSGGEMLFQPLTIQGDTFRVANQPGFVLDISPDIRVDLGPERIDVGGRVDIPYARIETITFESAITPSADVVVVDDPPQTTATAVPLHVRLLLAAGDDVLIDTYGLRGRIGGQLRLQLEPGRPLAGNGQLSVHDASFSLYGKRLKIDTGRLLFSGGALTNPGIEIRSQHTADNATVGFQVDGFLKTPRVRLYSRPVMDQGAIVSRLLEDSSSLGGSSRDDIGLVGDTAKRLGMGGLVPYLEGIKRISMIDDIRLDTQEDKTSLVFGTWVTRDFYVSYGKSLTGEGGTFNTRYTLGKGFVLETESGETQNSGDIKYEYER